MSYRDELTAALSRIEMLERELAGARQDAAELAAARTELVKLRAENASLRRAQFALPRAAVVRLVIGLVIAVLACFYLVASWGAADGEPPGPGLMAGPLAAIGAFVAGCVIGFAGPHRAAALAALGGTGVLLTSKPWVAPVLSTYGGAMEPHRINSETHFYFLVSGLIAMVLTVLIFAGTAGKKR